MTQVQQESVLFNCPRCGGLMRKLSGSTLYWHADNNHPRCSITNIVGAALAVKTDEKSGESSSKQKRVQ